MTEQEAIERIKSGICDEKGTARYCHDNCMYGEDKCAYSMAIKALEEIQKYRAIGTVEECRAAVGKQKKIRNNAIDDFAKWLENKKYLIKEIQDNYLCYTHYDELKADYVITEYLAEQLKGGVEE